MNINEHFIEYLYYKGFNENALYGLLSIDFISFGKTELNLIFLRFKEISINIKFERFNDYLRKQNYKPYDSMSDINYKTIKRIIKLKSIL